MNTDLIKKNLLFHANLNSSRFKFIMQRNLTNIMKNFISSFKKKDVKLLSYLHILTFSSYSSTFPCNLSEFS